MASFSPSSQLMARAIELSKIAMRNGDHPFGALLANDEGEIVWEGVNNVNTVRLVPF